MNYYWNSKRFGLKNVKALTSNGSIVNYSDNVFIQIYWKYRGDYLSVFNFFYWLLTTFFCRFLLVMLTYMRNQGITVDYGCLYQAS